MSCSSQRTSPDSLEGMYRVKKKLDFCRRVHADVERGACSEALPGDRREHSSFRGRARRQVGLFYGRGQFRVVDQRAIWFDVDCRRDESRHRIPRFFWNSNNRCVRISCFSLFV